MKIALRLVFAGGMVAPIECDKNIRFARGVLREGFNALSINRFNVVKLQLANRHQTRKYLFIFKMSSGGPKR